MGVVADSPDLRDDLRIARSRGISLRRFHGWEPTTYTTRAGHTYRDSENDAWERALWRAFDQWELTRCSGCGNSLEESLWDPDVPFEDRPKWWASFTQCLACKTLLLAQGTQSKEDEKMQKAMGEGASALPTQHRHWSVVRDDIKGR